MAGKLRRAMAWLEQEEGWPKKFKIITDRDHNDSIPSNALIVKDISKPDIIWTTGIPCGWTLLKLALYRGCN